MVSRTVLRPPSSSIPEEATLLGRARAGDREAQDALLRLHFADVYQLAVRILGDGDLAEDATQDAMLNALRGIGQFRGDASFRTWLLRVALNAARSLARRRGRRREVGLQAAENQPSGERDTAEAAAAQKDAAGVAVLLDRLPPKQRLAVSLRIHQGLSYPEIAGVLGCTEGAARVNYHLGIKRLREWVK
jgi:RNA polymerase sigma-70 factor (ECF subfamily)